MPGRSNLDVVIAYGGQEGAQVEKEGSRQCRLDKEESYKIHTDGGEEIAMGSRKEQKEQKQ